MRFVPLRSWSPRVPTRPSSPSRAIRGHTERPHPQKSCSTVVSSSFLESCPFWAIWARHCSEQAQLCVYSISFYIQWIQCIFDINYIYIYIYIYTPIYVCVYISIYLSIDLSIYLSISLSLSLYIYIYIYIYMCVYIHICMYIYIYIYVYTYIHLCAGFLTGGGVWLCGP